MLKLGHFGLMSNMLTVSFIAFIIGELSNIKKIVKKVKIKGFEIELKDEKQKTFTNVAIELLENNFPVLTSIGQNEVNQRVSKWLKDFLSEIEKQKISVTDTKLFYDPDFQFVLNKAIEIVARRNNELINKTLITLLIERLKYSNSSDFVYVNQIYSVITEDMPKLCEEHFKMLSSIYLFEHLSDIARCQDVEYFKKVIIPLIGHFVDEDAKCYIDIQRSNFVLMSGNPTLESLKNGLYFSEDKGIYTASNIYASFWDYVTNEYPFLAQLPREEKLELLKNKTLKSAEIKFNKIYRYALLTPISAFIIGDFLNEQLVLFDSKYAGQNEIKTLILNKEDK